MVATIIIGGNTSAENSTVQYFLYATIMWLAAPPSPVSSKPPLAQASDIAPAWDGLPSGYRTPTWGRPSEVLVDWLYTNGEEKSLAEKTLSRRRLCCWYTLDASLIGRPRRLSCCIPYTERSVPWDNRSHRTESSKRAKKYATCMREQICANFEVTVRALPLFVPVVYRRPPSWWACTELVAKGKRKGQDLLKSTSVRYIPLINESVLRAP